MMSPKALRRTFEKLLSNPATNPIRFGNDAAELTVEGVRIGLALSVGSRTMSVYRIKINHSGDEMSKYERTFNISSALKYGDEMPPLAAELEDLEKAGQAVLVKPIQEILRLAEEEAKKCERQGCY